MSIAYGGVIAFLFRIANLVVALGTVLLTSDQLGDAGRGTFVLGVTVVGVAAAMTGGLTASTAYQIANQGRPPLGVLLNGSLPALAIAIVVFAVSGGVAGGASGELSEIAIPVGASVAAVLVHSVVTGVLLGQEAFVRYNSALVLPPALSLVAIAVTLWGLDETSAEATLTAFAVGQWAAVPLVLALVLTASRAFGGFEPALVRALAGFGLLAAMASTISYLNYRADLFVVDHFEGRDGVGVYGNAVYIAESVWLLSSSFALAAYARLGTLEAGEAALLTARIVRHTMIALGVVCLGIFVLADVMVDLLFSEEFSGMTDSLRILLPGTLIYGMAAALSGYYTYQRGQPWFPAVIAGLALAIDLALAVVLVPAMGVEGAAVATTLSYAVAMVLAVAVFSRQSALSPLALLRFGREDIDDYRALATRLRAAARR